MYRMRNLLFFAVGIQLVACADAPLSPTEEMELEAPREVCPEGFELGEGACIPGIGRGEVTTPDEPFEAPSIDNSDLDEQRAYFLTQEGDGKYFVYTNQTIRVGVRAVTNVGQPAVGHRVTFEKIETGQRPSGARLSARQADTNEFGVAHIEVTGGPEPSFFRLQMTAGDTTGLTYQVNVILPPEGGVVPPDPGEPGNPPGGGLGGNCLEAQGTYRVVNEYEPARFLGDGPFRVLDTIHRALSDPGGLVGDLIRDRIGGIWGSLIRGAIQPVINYLYRYVVDNYAPDWVRWMLIITEDITAVLTELEIQGTMDLGRVDPDTCELTGRHRWEVLVFKWRAGCPPNDDRCGRYEVPLNQLGVAASESDFDARITRTIGPVAEMEISEHRLQLNLGVAVIWFIQNVILPQRLNVNSFGDLLELVLPCEAVGQLAADYLSGVPIVGFAIAPFVEDACEAGMEAAGNYLTRLLAEAINVNAFPMAGQCKLRDNDGDRRSDRIEEGRWTSGLQGSFAGDRLR